MSVTRLLASALAVVVAGFMAFDGTRALFLGSLIAPNTGPHAGQLGPWRIVASAVGIDPAGLLMRWIFALYGWMWLGIALAFVLRLPWAWSAMLAAAIGALWFLPFGTSIGLVLIAILVLDRGTLR